MSKSNGVTSDLSAFASGQNEPRWPKDQPVNLQLRNFQARFEGHPPPGTIPEEVLPEGVSRPKLFESVKLPQSDLTLKNAIVVSPMCQYASLDGFTTPYHIAHLGSFAIHGVGTIMIEASGVEERGRITPQDLGIWKDEHIPGLTSLVSTLKTIAPGLTVGIQLAHAGRKASESGPYDRKYRGPGKTKCWVPKSDNGLGWEDNVVAPSAIAYDGDEGNWIVPRALETAEVEHIQRAFVQAADRAFEAGCDYVELHAAHGYLLHSFLSPLSNKRTDKYGGSFENRTRLLIETAKEVKSKYPSKSLWVRVSSTDFAEHVEADGTETWNIDGTVRLAPLLAEAGVDVLDCSAGGLVNFQKIKPGPAYQLPYAEAVSNLKLRNMLTGSVGILEGDTFTGEVAEKALQDGKADLVFLARGLMARPSWPEDAAAELTGVRCAGNPAYHRVHPAKKPPPRENNHN